MQGANPLQTALTDGTVIYGADARTFSTATIELFGSIGYDYVWLDYEHAGPSPFDTSTVETHARAAAAADTEPVVRIPKRDPKAMGAVLDAGVRTVVVPQIETAETVDRMVRAARFPTGDAAGARGVGPSRSNEWATALDGYVDRENAEAMVGAMIETEAAVNNIEAIVDVPALGFLFIGPSDLSLSMTGAIDTEAPVVIDAIETVLDVAAAAGVPVGRSFPSVAGARAAAEAERGYQMISLGRDLSAVHETFADRLDGVR